jgi:hypothetical protein
MANEEKRLAEVNPEVDPDPLTDSRTVAQTPTSDEQITELPETENPDGENVRAGDFDETTGAAHPAEDSGADRGVDQEN